MDKRTGGIDLHIHTTSSDGTRTVFETMQDAHDFGLSHVAITDHNQFALLQPVVHHGMEVIPGAEFSTAYTTETGKLLEVHVIGLFFDGIPAELGNVFKEIPIQRKQYLDTIIGKLNQLDISISYEELIGNFPDSNQIGRRHIAEILVKKGYAMGINDAFDRLIGNRSPYWVDSTKYMKYMPLKKCMDIICQNGGFPILAHPYHYHCTDEEVFKLVNDFKTFAGDCPAGMEVYYSKYDKERRDELLNLAKKMDLYPSAASDRHAEKDSFVRGEEELLQNMKDAVRKRK
jgi:predicted metal-dependent phosphoesterase TrpH